MGGLLEGEGKEGNLFSNRGGKFRNPIEYGHERANEISGANATHKGATHVREEGVQFLGKNVFLVRRKNMDNGGEECGGMGGNPREKVMEIQGERRCSELCKKSKEPGCDVPSFPEKKPAHRAGK